MAVEIIAGVKIVAKLIGTGMSVYRAARTRGKPEELESDFKVIQDLLDAGAQVATAWSGNATTRVQARHVGLVASAFGQAWLEQYRPRLAFEKLSSLDGHREAAVHWALFALPRLGDKAPAGEIALLDQLLGGVLETPYYRALWESFTKRHLPDLDHDWPEPLLDVVDGNDKRAFEARVRRAYAEALTSPVGHEVRSYLLEIASDRGRLVRELLVRDLSTWGARHVFGNVATHARLPEMPLAEMYVEPFSVAQFESLRGNDAGTPITELAARMLETSPVLVVTAHFGHGKSLSARTMAWKLANDYLDDAATPGPDRAVPVFVKCVEDLVGGEARLPRMTERALWRHVGMGFQLGLRDSDAAFTVPDGQRAVFLIDGLDEVALSAAAVTQLFEHLRRHATDRHKVIVFSRPEVLPRKRLRELAIPVLELQPFTFEGPAGGQVGEWLSKWNRHSGRQSQVHVDEIASRGLSDLARTPILLFMIAETWGAVDEAGGKIRQADLYEAFLSRIARGKHEYDRDNHTAIAEAAEHLQRRLVKRARLPADATLDQAMLWALSRVAWESHCLEQKEKTLTQRRVIELLESELGVEDEATHQALCDGLLLALQADFAPGSSRILFGHRSFREFLVARFWERALSSIVAQDSATWRSRETDLLGGRLMGLEDRSFAFLLEILEHWSEPARSALRRWAEQTVNDERISLIAGTGDAMFYHDRRAYLREAALAIGSCVPGSAGLELRGETVLRSLLAWFWAHGEQALIRAPRLRHPGAKLHGVTMFAADLEAAHLQGADFSRAQLADTNLARARLSYANLNGVQLTTSSLAGAHVDHASLLSTFFADTDLTRTSFVNAKLRFSALSSCAMQGTDFSGASLQGTCLNVADARRAGAIFTDDSGLAGVMETLYGRGDQRPGLCGEIIDATSDSGIWPSTRFLFNCEFDEAGASEGAPPADRSHFKFEIMVPAEMSDTLIQIIGKIAGVLSIGRTRTL